MTDWTSDANEALTLSLGESCQQNDMAIYMDGAALVLNFTSEGISGQAGVSRRRIICGLSPQFHISRMLHF